MALQTGHSQEVVSANVAGLVAAGYTQDDAEHVATSSAEYWRSRETAEAQRQVGAISIENVTAADKSIFFAPIALGKTRRYTPEGYLVCEGVPIARTGVQIYREGEIEGLKGNADGVISVKRTPEVVFDPQHMASLEGKSVTWNHPPKNLDPKTYRDWEFGTVHNLRQGTGIEDDLLLADFLIKDQTCIDYANTHKPDVSEGYNSKYTQIEPGLALQSNLIGNHVALVRNGRAGPRCSVKDADIQTLVEETKMSKTTYFGRIRAALIAAGVKTADAESTVAELQAEEAAEVEARRTTDAMTSVSNDIKALVTKVDTGFTTFDTRMTALEKQIKTMDEKEEETAEEKAARLKKEGKGANDTGESSEEITGDTIIEAETVGKVLSLGKVYTGDSSPLLQVAARAELLSPGIRIPTADELKPNKDGSAMGGFMRRTLVEGLKGKHGGSIKAVLSGRTVDSLRGDALLSVYNAASEVVRMANNGSTVSSAGPAQGMRTADSGSKRLSVADINKRNAEYRANKQASGIGAVVAKR